MDGYDPAAFREAFLQANANEDYVTDRLEELLRIVLRSAIAQDAGRNVPNLIEQARHVREVIARCERPDVPAMLGQALCDVLNYDVADDVERATLGAARAGMAYLIEATAHDSAARGRASKRRSEFVGAMRLIEELRDYRRKEWSRRP